MASQPPRPSPAPPSGPVRLQTASPSVWRCQFRLCIPHIISAVSTRRSFLHWYACRHDLSQNGAAPGLPPVTQTELFPAASAATCHASPESSSASKTAWCASIRGCRNKGRGARIQSDAPQSAYVPYFNTWCRLGTTSLHFPSFLASSLPVRSFLPLFSCLLLSCDTPGASYGHGEWLCRATTDITGHVNIRYSRVPSRLWEHLLG